MLKRIIGRSGVGKFRAVALLWSFQEMLPAAAYVRLLFLRLSNFWQQQFSRKTHTLKSRGVSFADFLMTKQEKSFFSRTSKCAHIRQFIIFISPGRTRNRAACWKEMRRQSFWPFSFRVKCVRDFFLFCREDDIVLSWQKKGKPQNDWRYLVLSAMMEDEVLRFFSGCALKASCDEVWRCVEGTEREIFPSVTNAISGS